MQPAPVEAEEANNRQFLQVFAEKGDIQSRPINVDFAAHFPSEVQRQQFLEAIKENGFQETDKWKPAPDDFWCEIVKTTTTDPDTTMPQPSTCAN